MRSLTEVDNVSKSNVSKFKEITVERGKEIILLLQHEDKLTEFPK